MFEVYVLTIDTHIYTYIFIYTPPLGQSLSNEVSYYMYTCTCVYYDLAVFLDTIIAMAKCCHTTIK